MTVVMNIIVQPHLLLLRQSRHHHLSAAPGTTCRADRQINASEQNSYATEWSIVMICQMKPVAVSIVFKGFSRLIAGYYLEKKIQFTVIKPPLTIFRFQLKKWLGGERFDFKNESIIGTLILRTLLFGRDKRLGEVYGLKGDYVDKKILFSISSF